MRSIRKHISRASQGWGRWIEAEALEGGHGGAAGRGARCRRAAVTQGRSMGAEPAGDGQAAVVPAWGREARTWRMGSPHTPLCLHQQVALGGWGAIPAPCRKMGAGGGVPAWAPLCSTPGCEAGVLVGTWVLCRGAVVTRNPSETRFSAVFPFFFFFLSSFWLYKFFIVQKV